MLTREDFEVLRALVQEHILNDGLRIEIMRALNRVTDPYSTNDVIARGPDLSSTHMMNDAAKALGWRVDFACGDSPITWDLVIDEIHKRTKQKTIDVVECASCKGRAAVKKKEGKRVEAVCIDCGCGMQWTNA